MRLTAAQYLCKFWPPLSPDQWPYSGFKNKDEEYNDPLQCVDEVGDIPYVVRSPYEPWHNFHHPVDAHHAKQAEAHAESGEQSELGLDLLLKNIKKL
jgi:hypothetical protein